MSSRAEGGGVMLRVVGVRWLLAVTCLTVVGICEKGKFQKGELDCTVMFDMLLQEGN